MANSPALTTIPVELQRGVIDYIKSYADLRAVCLVCKAFNTFAAPKLYRNIVLPVDALEGQDLRAQLNPQNENLKFTRSLTILETGGSLYEDKRFASQGFDKGSRSKSSQSRHRWLESQLLVPTRRSRAWH